jgi:hypothetical protein
LFLSENYLEAKLALSENAFKEDECDAMGARPINKEKFTFSHNFYVYEQCRGEKSCCSLIISWEIIGVFTKFRGKKLREWKKFVQEKGVSKSLEFVKSLSLIEEHGRRRHLTRI